MTMPETGQNNRACRMIYDGIHDAASELGKSEKILFTKEMKKDYTILAPNMLPIHFMLLKSIFRSYGYNVEVLNNDGPSVIEQGLKYVHNDTCYPALLVIGQMIDALNSGEFDINKTALMITQTGGGCRASNYIYLLRKALKKAGYGHVPVASLNFAGLEKDSGIKMTLPMMRKALVSIIYSDTLMLLDNQVKPYEIVKGQSKRTVDFWVSEISRQFEQGKGCSLKEFEVNLNDIVETFSFIKVSHGKKKIRVGIVGEIYIKFSDLGNNNLNSFLRKEGCEVMVPGLLGFILYSLDAVMEDARLYGGSKIKSMIASILMNYFLKFEKKMIEAVSSYPLYIAPLPFKQLKSLVNGIISPGCKMGEGWLLVAEMVELIENGYENIICVQPFGCLPNHVAGKGMIRKIKSVYNCANIVPIDYDPGATRVNQENRIKLMLSVAKREKDGY